MATTIKLKNGSGAPLAGDLVQGEPALDLTNKRLYTENASGTVIEVGTNPTSLTTGTFTSTGIDDNATSTAITIDSSENVGIGTASPITPLDVFGKQRIYLNNTNVGNASSLQLTQDGTGDAAISFLIGATTEWLAGVDNSDSDKFKISNITGGSDFTATGMTIDSSGNVGIGTASPSAKLDISGAAPVLELTDTGSTASYGWQPTANDLRLFDFNASLERLRIDSSGNVGIGTTSPNATLAFGGSSDVAFNTSLGSTGTYGQIKAFNTLAPSNPATNIRFIRDVASVGNDGAICFDTVNTERMRIDSSGKLLVGKTSPSITTAGTEITSSSLLQSVSDTSTNLATNGGAVLNLCNTSATDGNFSNIGGYNSNGLVVSQMNFINLNHTSRTGAITLSTHNGTSLNEAMRIDSSGNVGIGTASPSSYNSAMNDLVVAGSADSGITIASGTTNEGSIAFADGTSGADAYRGWINYNHNSNFMRFFTNATERMRITSGGALLVGTTDVSLATVGAKIRENAQANFITSDFGAPLFLGTAGAGTATMVQFYGSANTTPTDAGRITSASGGTPAFASASDIRLKDNVTDHESELTNILSLRPVRWDWKDNAWGSGEGFIGQELEETAWSDLVSENEAGYKIVSGLGIVETRLIKAIQELSAQVTELQAEVAALKGA
jgi:hypothetical protein